jgi:hypothetical protein
MVEGMLPRRVTTAAFILLLTGACGSRDASRSLGKDGESTPTDKSGARSTNNAQPPESEPATLASETATVEPDMTPTEGQASAQAAADGDDFATNPTPSINGEPGTQSPPTMDESIAEEALLPQRIRRLSNVELGNSVRALLGTEEPHEASLPRDLRQENFTINEAQTVSSDWNAALERVARAAAAGAALDLDRLSPCPGETSDACARQFIESLATKAFRRQTHAEELEELEKIYDSGVLEGGFDRGMELVIAAVLQSPSFIYLTELGDANGLLTGEEIASALAYATTQSPPDEELMDLAQSGALADTDERGRQARRLLSTEAGSLALQEMIVQWFAADWVLDAAKDDIPEFNQHREALLQESRDFARMVVTTRNANIVTLLTADFTVASQAVAEYYGLEGSGHVSLEGTPRLGIVTQAAFLGGHASPTGSSPVRRGAAFMRHVLCTDPPDPAEVDLVVAAPAPDPSLSTRQLFAAHASDEMCQGCHSMIDPIGFAFEEFDEGGRVRSMESNNGHPVDASGAVSLAGETFEFENAADFLTQVAASDLAQICIAKKTTRYAFATRNPATEETFVDVWRELPEDQRTQLDEVLVKLIESELFVRRRTP